MQQNLLRFSTIALRILRPAFQASLLQGAAVRKAQWPRHVTDAVHGIEVSGGFLIALAARQKDHASGGGGHRIEQTIDGGFSHFRDAGTLLGGAARNHHRRFQDRAFQHDILLIELLEQRFEGRFGDIKAGVQIMVTVHQYFGFNNWHNAGFLTQRGVARQGVRVGFNAGPRRQVFSNRDDRTPLGELGPQLGVLGQTLTQSIEAFGDQFAFKPRQRFGTCIHFDAWQNARLVHQVHY